MGINNNYRYNIIHPESLKKLLNDERRKYDCGIFMEFKFKARRKKKKKLSNYTRVLYLIFQTYGLRPSANFIFTENPPLLSDPYEFYWNFYSEISIFTLVLNVLMPESDRKFQKLLLSAGLTYNFIILYRVQYSKTVLKRMNAEQQALKILLKNDMFIGWIFYAT